MRRTFRAAVVDFHISNEAATTLRGTTKLLERRLAFNHSFHPPRQLLDPLAFEKKKMLRTHTHTHIVLLIQNIGNFSQLMLATQSERLPRFYFYGRF